MESSAYTVARARRSSFVDIAKANILRLDYLASKGFDPRMHSPDFYLQVAVECDKTATDCGPFDPAFEHFKSRARLAFEAALLAEEIRT